MGLLSFLRKRPVKERGKGILVFAHTAEVIRAEKVLKHRGYPVRVMGPPPEVRAGCDLVIEFPLIEQLEVVRVLTECGLRPLSVVAVRSSLLEPVSLFQVKDFGTFLMVRAANMKLSVEKATGLIVNVSGGGCPDVPFVARQII